jgi:hypothetical protein
VIGEVQRLLDQGVEVDRPALARDPARVFEHALDDAVGALAVLGDLVEVAAQHLDDLVDRGALVVGERCHGRRRRLLQLQQQLTRELGKIVDKVEGVLISCAIPAVSWPSAAIFWACRRLACVVFSSSSARSAVSRAAWISPRRACARLRRYRSPQNRRPAPHCGVPR